MGSDFQYVLHTKLRTGNGTGWQCPMPCTSTFLASATSAAPTFMATTSTTTSSTTIFTTTTIIASSSGFPWWCWLLLVLLVGLCFGAVVASRAFLLEKGRQGTKKKRAAPAEIALLTDPEQQSGLPMQVTPVPKLQPTRDYAVPAYPALVAPVAQSLFDQADTNRDGVITRDEYARLSLFDQLDTNHDGVLTRDELARWR